MAHQVADIGHVGSQPFNHQQSQGAEQEYDRLRDLARQAASKRSSCFDRAHQAYEQGDGAAAHALSEEGKQHSAQMEAYNKQASDFIFRENNAESRVASDTIDLHGQYAEEGEDILEKRIRHARSTGQTHLHVIVGKGSHSPQQVQKLKPMVEKVCQELGLQCRTEDNEGRIYIDLSGGGGGGPAGAPPAVSGGAADYYGGSPNNYGAAQGQDAYAQQPGGQPQQEQAHHKPQSERVKKAKKMGKKVARKLGPILIRKLQREVCIIM